MKTAVYSAHRDPAAHSVRRRLGIERVLAIWRQPEQRRLAVALAAAFASALAFARVTEDYLTNDPLARWDVSFARWLAEHRGTAGVDVFRTVTDFGSPAVSALVAGVVAVVLYRRRQFADAMLLPLAVGVGELLNLALKLAFHRARPDVAFVQIDTYSYPSGHAMIAILAYGGCAYLFWSRINPGRRRWLMLAGLTVLVALISFSRLYLGVHYLSDVLGGLCAGAAWLAMSIALIIRFGSALASRLRMRS